MQQPGEIRTIRGDYDRIAVKYATQLYRELGEKPLDCDLLRRFATSTRGMGAVCDMGCGPGQVARFLRDNGVDVFGLDLSPGMLESARKLNPDLEFREGDMLELPLSDNELAGIAAFYAIVNLHPEWLPKVFAEMHRVLAPNGLLLLAFHVGDEVLRPANMFGHSISMEFYYFAPVMIQAHLTEAGFKIEGTVEREPYAPDVEHQSRRAYIFARKAKDDVGGRTDV